MFLSSVCMCWPWQAEVLSSAVSSPTSAPPRLPFVYVVLFTSVSASQRDAD